jgi:glycosyltransferase involved in cell wall biosynthesis
MRIAFFSDNFYPELSGITDTIITTGKELKKRGHEICYVAPHYSPKDYGIAKRQHPLSREHDTIDDMPIVRLPSLPLPFSPTGQSRFTFPFGNRSTFPGTFRPDVIHTQDPYGVGWEALRAARRLRVPLVGTNHTAIEDFFPLSSLARAYDAWYYNHCDFVTTPYETLISRMREKGFRQPARAVANPVELASFTPATAMEKAEHKKSFGLTGPVVLYAGRLGTEKNVDVVLRAVALLVKKFPTLTFVATGHGAAEPKLKALAQKLNIGRHVHFTGFLSRVTLPHAYKTADVFAMMSTSDSQSIALMQSYACGVPAVCARSRGLPDYTPSDCGYLVAPGDYRALAEKISVLLTDAEVRERMGKAALAFVTRFSPATIAEEWERIYQTAIAHPRNV